MLRNELTLTKLQRSSWNFGGQAMRIMVVDLHPEPASAFCNRLPDTPHSINPRILPGSCHPNSNVRSDGFQLPLWTSCRASYARRDAPNNNGRVMSATASVEIPGI